MVNREINYGAEYVWHCHLLGHEENIMTRPMAVALTPRAPSGLTGAGTAGNVVLSFTDNSKNEKLWQVERSTSSDSGPWAIVGTQDTATEGGTGTVVYFTDTTAVAGTTYYYYRVFAVNVVGDTTTYLPPASEYTNMSTNSEASNSATVVTP